MSGSVTHPPPHGPSSSDPLRCVTLHPGLGLGFLKLLSPISPSLCVPRFSGFSTMEEPSSSSSSSSSSHGAFISRDTSGAAATSSSSASQVREEEDDHNQYQQHTDFRHPEVETHEIGTSYGANLSPFDEVSTIIRDDTWSCIIVLLTFWFFGLYLYLIFKLTMFLTYCYFLFDYYS